MPRRCSQRVLWCLPLTLLQFLDEVAASRECTTARQGRPEEVFGLGLLQVFHKRSSGSAVAASSSSPSTARAPTLLAQEVSRGAPEVRPYDEARDGKDSGPSSQISPRNDTDGDGVILASANRTETDRGTIQKEVVAYTHKKKASLGLYPGNVTENADHLLESVEHIFTKVLSNVGFSPQGTNTTQEARQPFVKVTKHQLDNGPTIKTSIKVDLMKPADILVVYLLIFMPLIVVWLAYFSRGAPQAHLALLLPVTVLATTLGMDFANQSLAAVIGGPNLLTALQSSALAIITGAWTFFFRRDQVSKVQMHSLWAWMAAAGAFVLTQLVNHIAYWNCSLYERTIFLNICPIATVLLERTVMPLNLRPVLGAWHKVALSVTVLGAVLLGLQGFGQSTSQSILTSGLLASSLVLTRLLQRFLLAEHPNLPVGLLAAVDGLLLAVTSGGFALTEVDYYSMTWTAWLDEPSVCMLVGISMITFTVYHVVILMILRFTTATNALVFMNIANIVNVFLGVQFFAETTMTVFLTPLAFAGLGVSLFSGLWYTAYAEMTDAADALEAPKGYTSSAQPAAQRPRIYQRSATTGP